MLQYPIKHIWLLKRISILTSATERNKRRWMNIPRNFFPKQMFGFICKHYDYDCCCSKLNSLYLIALIQYLLWETKNPVVFSHYLNKASYLNSYNWVFPNFNDDIARSLILTINKHDNFLLEVQSFKSSWNSP